MGAWLFRAIPVAALLAPACAESPNSVVELGSIEFSSHIPEPFVVTVTTFGGGCVMQDITVATSDDDGADVSPYDRRHILGEEEDGCTLELRRFPHEATIMFEAAGLKTIRVHGRRTVPPNDDIIEVAFEVAVQ